MAENEEYKFPDETETPTDQADESDIDVKIEDDTPEEDKGRKPLAKEVVDELENDNLDEYSQKVKKRLTQMKRVWHDERREKERAAREKDEALRFAQVQMEENKRLKQRLGMNEKAFIHEITKSATNDLSVAKDKLKSAYESGDAEQIASAQEMMTDAKLKLQEYSRFRPSLQQNESGVQVNEQVQAPQASAPVADHKATAWREKNAWFGADEEMTALALGLHEKLVRSGVDPRSDDYYRRIDETMRKRFPESFDEDEETPKTKEAEKPARAKPANVVAPVTRSTAPRQVRLTPTQVALAKKLGLSNEQYALEVMKLETNNG